MAEVKVRAETPMLGLSVGSETTVERSALVDAAIDDGRLTVLDEGAGEGPLRGEALDDALREHGLSTSGRADAKRRRLDAHMDGEHSDDELNAGETLLEATPPVLGVASSAPASDI